MIYRASIMILGGALAVITGCVQTSSLRLTVQNMNLREANLAYECSDALHYLLLDPANTSKAIIRQQPGLRLQFDKFCQKFGYKIFGAETTKFNEQHRDRLKEILREVHPDAPLGTRTYDNKGRSPGIFSGY